MTDRPKQFTPPEMVDRLMAIIRAQFCGDQGGAEWGKNSHFIRRNVVLWPAHFVCNVRNFTLPAGRYEEIMRSIFDGIKKHGQTGQIRYWPGYLMKCVQDHWKHHWEDYYKESKSAARLEESALIALGRLPVRSDGVVESLAGAHQILARKAKRKRARTPSEQSLPGL